MDDERAYGLLGMREQDGRAMEGMLLNQTVTVAATNPEEDDTRGDTKFNASQYAFFGNNVMEEVELGGLEDDDCCDDADFVGLGDEGYSSIHGSDMLEDEGVGSFSAGDDLAGTFSKLTRVVNGPRHRGIVGRMEPVSRQSSSTADWTQQEPESSYWPKQHALDAEQGLDNKKWSSHLAQFSDTRLHRTSSSPHQDAQYNPTEHILGPRPFSLHRMSSYPQQDPQYNHTEPIPVPKLSFIPYPPSSVSHSSSGGPHHMNIPSPPTAFHMPVSAQNELPFSHPHHGGTPSGPLFGRNLVQMGLPGLSTNIMQQNHGLNSGPIHGNGARFTPALMERPNGLIPPQMQPPHQQHGIRPIQQSSPQFSQLNPHMLGPRHSPPQNLQMFGPQHPPSQTRGRFDANFGMPDLSDPRARSMLYHGRQGQFLPPQGFELGNLRMDTGWPRFRSKYMSTEEIENIARVQQAATHSNDPYIDDYYHQACLARKSAGAHLRNHFCPTLIRDPSARACSKDEPHAYLQVDALGRLPFSSIRRPRPLLDVEEASTPSDSIPEKTASKTLDQEPMLAARITIEDGLCHLLDVDDINRLLQFSQQQDGGLELTNRRYALLEQLAESLQLVDPLGPNKSVPLSPNDDLVFLRVISLPKGRKLVSRYLELVTPSSELARIACMAVFRHLRFIFGNLPSDSSAAASTTKLASAISTCIGQMELSGLSACLAATVCSSLQPPLRPLGYAAGDGASVIIMSVLDRATELLTDQHVSSTYSMQNRGLWQASFDAFFRLLTEYCMSKFDNLVHTAQMQPCGAAAISREIPVELLRASLPHTNEHQRKQLLNFAQRTVPYSSAKSSHESGDGHTASGGPKLS
uniref:Uncharacterized protein n=1 Tax=Avena sativa TaxID=4498 RepID=A0ACD5UNP6_AVESA